MLNVNDQQAKALGTIAARAGKSDRLEGADLKGISFLDGTGKEITPPLFSADELKTMTPESIAERLISATAVYGDITITPDGQPPMIIPKKMDEASSATKPPAEEMNSRLDQLGKDIEASNKVNALTGKPLESDDTVIVSIDDLVKGLPPDDPLVKCLLALKDSVGTAKLGKGQDGFLLRDIKKIVSFLTELSKKSPDEQRAGIAILTKCFESRKNIPAVYTTNGGKWAQDKGVELLAASPLGFWGLGNNLTDVSMLIDFLSAQKSLVGSDAKAMTYFAKMEDFAYESLISQANLAMFDVSSNYTQNTLEPQLGSGKSVTVRNTATGRDETLPTTNTYGATGEELGLMKDYFKYMQLLVTLEYLYKFSETLQTLLTTMKTKDPQSDADRAQIKQLEESVGQVGGQIYKYQQMDQAFGTQLKVRCADYIKTFPDRRAALEKSGYYGLSNIVALADKDFAHYASEYGDHINFIEAAHSNYNRVETLKSFYTIMDLWQGFRENPSRTSWTSFDGTESYQVSPAKRGGMYLLTITNATTGEKRTFSVYPYKNESGPQILIYPGSIDDVGYGKAMPAWLFKFSDDPKKIKTEKDQVKILVEGHTTSVARFTDRLVAFSDDVYKQIGSKLDPGTRSAQETVAKNFNAAIEKFQTYANQLDVYLQNPTKYRDQIAQMLVALADLKKVIDQLKGLKDQSQIKEIVKMVNAYGLSEFLFGDGYADKGGGEDKDETRLSKILAQPGALGRILDNLSKALDSLEDGIKNMIKSGDTAVREEDARRVKLVVGILLVIGATVATVLTCGAASPALAAAGASVAGAIAVDVGIGIGIGALSSGLMYLANFGIDKAYGLNPTFSLDDLFKNMLIGAAVGGTMAFGGAILGTIFKSVVSAGAQGFLKTFAAGFKAPAQAVVTPLRSSLTVAIGSTLASEGGLTIFDEWVRQNPETAKGLPDWMVTHDKAGNAVGLNEGFRFWAGLGVGIASGVAAEKILTAKASAGLRETRPKIAEIVPPEKGINSTMKIKVYEEFTATDFARLGIELKDGQYTIKGVPVVFEKVSVVAATKTKPYLATAKKYAGKEIPAAYNKTTGELIIPDEGKIFDVSVRVKTDTGAALSDQQKSLFYFFTKMFQKGEIGQDEYGQMLQGEGILFANPKDVDVALGCEAIIADNYCAVTPKFRERAGDSPDIIYGHNHPRGTGLSAEDEIGLSLFEVREDGSIAVNEGGETLVHQSWESSPGIDSTFRATTPKGLDEYGAYTESKYGVDTIWKDRYLAKFRQAGESLRPQVDILTEVEEYCKAILTIPADQRAAYGGSLFDRLSSEAKKYIKANILSLDKLRDLARTDRVGLVDAMLQEKNSIVFTYEQEILQGSDSYYLGKASLRDAEVQKNIATDKFAPGQSASERIRLKRFIEANTVTKNILRDVQGKVFKDSKEAASYLQAMRDQLEMAKEYFVTKKGYDAQDIESLRRADAALKALIDDVIKNPPKGTVKIDFTKLYRIVDLV
jgi:hypothetical protein